MGETPEDSPQEKTPEAVDLSSLKDLSFTPDWGSSKGSITRQDKKGGRGGPRSDSSPGASGAARKDRRPPRKERSFEPSGDSQGRGGPRKQGEGENRRGGKRFDKNRPPIFKPTVEVSIYPEDEPFKVLVKAIRSSYRTYELFDIARLIIEKPERFVAVVRPLGGKEEESPLYLSTQDSAVFESEDAAVSHVVQNALENMFEVEEVEIDPPTGNFQMVNRCGLTGELLGPPNYHRYQDYLNEHYSTRIHNMPMERFLSKIETVREEEVVQEWIAKVSKANRYTLKVEGLPEGEEAPKFYGLEEVRRYIVTNKKDELVKKVSTARIPGTVVDKLPDGNIKKSVNAALEYQKKFPLDTANHLRARLRRLNFNIYKKGSKGISFVCVVKRKFRDENTQLAEAAQKLIDFIEKEPNILASSLPEKYLGIAPQETEPAAPEGEAPATPEADAAAPSPEPQAEIRSLKQNLRWLITEGYVTEYSDGKLFAPPPTAAPKPKVELSTPAPETVSAPEPATQPEAAVETTATEPATEPEAVGTPETSPTETVAESTSPSSEETPTEEALPEETDKTEPEEPKSSEG